MAQGNAFLNKMGSMGGNGLSDYLDLGDYTGASITYTQSQLSGRNYIILESNLQPGTPANIEIVGMFQITGQAYVALLNVLDVTQPATVNFNSNTNLHSVAFKA